MTDEGSHFHFHGKVDDKHMKWAIVLVIVAVILLVIILGVFGVLRFPGCEKAKQPTEPTTPAIAIVDTVDEHDHFTGHPGRDTVLVMVPMKGRISIPMGVVYGDIGILLPGNKWNSPRVLGDDISGIDAHHAQYSCPFYFVASSPNVFFTDDSALMVNFVEIKVGKIYADGTVHKVWIGYKPGPNESPSFEFETSCLPTLHCFKPFSNDTMWAGQWDLYFNVAITDSTGLYIVEITPNDAGNIRECGGCGNDHYYLVFYYEPILTSYGFYIWQGTRNDTLLAGKTGNQLVAQVKNLK